MVKLDNRLDRPGCWGCDSMTFRTRCKVQCLLSNVDPGLVLSIFQEKIELFLVGPITYNLLKLRWQMLATRFYGVLQCIPCIFFSHIMLWWRMEGKYLQLSGPSTYSQHGQYQSASDAGPGGPRPHMLELAERYHGGGTWHQMHVLHPVAHWYPLPYLTRCGEGQPFYLCAQLHWHQLMAGQRPI